MKNRGFIRRVAIIGCLAMLVTLLPILTLPAQGETWTRIDGGTLDPNNQLSLPGGGTGEAYKGKIVLGAGNADIFTPDPVTMYTYDTSFQAVGAPGFGNNDNTALLPWAIYDDLLWIGTENVVTGGELWKWNGSGNPDLVRANGFENPAVPTPNNAQVFPCGVYRGDMLLSVDNYGFGAGDGFRMYKYDGSDWTKLIGTGTPYQPGLGDPDYTGICPSENTIYNDDFIMPIRDGSATKGANVYSFDGTDFTKIGDSGDGWAVDHTSATGAVSDIDGVYYMGTGDENPITEISRGTLVEYDGSNWTTINLTGGLEDPDNYFFQPFVRGAHLYVAAWNDVDGCRVYKRTGSTFTPISQPGFGIGVPATNFMVVLSSYNGKLFAMTGNLNGTQIYTTPIPPSISKLVPASGPYGWTVAIQGHDFGVNQGSGEVTFNGASATDIVSWSDTLIEVMVPPKATAGPVQVSQSNGDSNQVDFTVTLSDTYYFAEGTTRDNAIDGTYEEWLCLQNPGATTANVTLTYMLTGGATEVQNVTVDPESRNTISVNDFLGADKDVSTLVESDQLILAERPMYFNYRNKWTGGHDVMGVPAPRDTYFFAEGTTRDNINDGSYEEWLCLQNPGGTDADVKVTYMLGTGQNIEETYPVGATSRETIDVNTAVGPDQDVSMLIESTVPIVAERPMYFNYRNKWTGGHDVVGAPGPDTEFYFAEGTTRDNPTDGSFEEWLCLQNPSDTDADVTITYYTAQVGTQTEDVTVGARSRYTVDVKLKLGADVDTACKVESTNNVPILAERPMYFNYHSIWPGGHDVMGCNAPKKSYYFAEGTTLTDFNTYVAVMNPGANAATVDFTYMIEGEPSQQTTVTIEPSKRFTQDVASVIGVNKNVSMLIESDEPIVAERPMYFGYKGWCAGGHDTLGYGI